MYLTCNKTPVLYKIAIKSIKWLTLYKFPSKTRWPMKEILLNSHDSFLYIYPYNLVYSVVQTQTNVTIEKLIVRDNFSKQWSAV